jgi:hypothetical protein
MKEWQRQVTGFLKFLREPECDRRIVEFIPLGRPVVLHATAHLRWRQFVG